MSEEGSVVVVVVGTRAIGFEIARQRSRARSSPILTAEWARLGAESVALS